MTKQELSALIYEQATLGAKMMTDSSDGLLEPWGLVIDAKGDLHACMIGVDLSPEVLHYMFRLLDSKVPGGAHAIALVCDIKYKLVPKGQAESVTSEELFEGDSPEMLLVVGRSPGHYLVGYQRYERKDGAPIHFTDPTPVVNDDYIPFAMLLPDLWGLVN